MSNRHNDPHSGQLVRRAGKTLEEAEAAMILVHGRGATADSILELANHLHHPDMAYLAPQANGNSWYPFSFLEELKKNEPGLSSGLNTIERLIEEIRSAGIPTDKIILAGFSQGACLASEFVARSAATYESGLGGLIVFSGGLIGPAETQRTYAGSLQNMPVFIGCSDVDFHIPEVRVHETAETLSNLGAVVDKQIYPGMGHTIIEDELQRANKVLATLMTPLQSK